MSKSKKEKGTTSSTPDLVKNQMQDTKKDNILSNIIDKEFQKKDGFPYDIFPTQIQNLIIDAENTIGFNPDYLSAGILSVCATAIGTTISLNNGSYSSHPILWLAIIGSQGTGKTHPLEFAKKPLSEKDNQNYKEFKELLKNYDNQETKSNKPNYIKTVLTDFTPEKLAETLQYNDKGVLIFKDELIGWINSFDQYKKGGDQQKYLEFFNGGVLSVDRVSKEPIRVEKTNINILGGLQPKKLKSLASNGRNDDGFLTRMLFVYATNLKPPKFTGKSINKIHVENYNRLILNLYDAPKLVLKTTESQIKTYQQWQHKKVKECFNDDLERSIQSKLETYTWRLILIIEMMQQASVNGFSENISNESIEKAIKLIEYFRINALRVFDKIFHNNPLEDLPLNKLDLYNKLPTNFQLKDIRPLLEEYNVKGGSIYRFLGDKSLFAKLNHTNYKKILV